MDIQITTWRHLPDWVEHSEHWFALSDTHARIEPFRELLAAAPEGARIIHLGDIADRGRYPYECYQEIASRPDMVLVMGNHDMMARKVLLELDMPMYAYSLWSQVWLRNGGGATMKEISGNEERESLLSTVFERQKLYHFDGNLFFVHSGLFPEDDFRFLEQKEDIDANELLNMNVLHLTWRADDWPQFWEQDENCEWKGFPVKPFFVHGHKRCSRTHGRDYTNYGEKAEFLPREDTWRVGVDSCEGMTALEIKDGQYRFYDIDGAPYLKA